MGSTTKYMAMFPLPVFLLPGEEIPLRIFEPRYKQLINECNETGDTFGIPYVSNNNIKSYGSEVELVNIVAKNSLGEMVILIKAIANFHLLNLKEKLPDKLYGGGIIEYIDDRFTTTNPELVVLVKKLNLNLDPIMGSLITGDSVNLMNVAKAIQLDSDEKFAFYSLRNEKQMVNYLIKRLRFIEHIQLQEKLLENNFSLN
ncbi:LON peptidase substrate-binding domain-containing protein [Bacteroidales bacterium]|uniref:LON peptidase substrate-binding domain-containing protein n=1 Tax=Tenuifilum sp. TaxID=2760880 RepID=UPI001B631EE6|nr:LON peptidase substrate-binding domain-containing protein [Bacteroidales bacterium]HOK60807.1 LON peptidase substrate-binding domain-containing protein [Tenuifilum sp.]HON69956.1 LON peptidase substrate-binding domain-containing protein [Tenuifilum sp.]HPP89694.1 LON peptidase substrate-binding domain-containing protein [Tenuifilum sp.]